MSSETPGARTFQVPGAAYDRFMGRYSEPLAAEFAGAVGVEPGQAVLDVGCGPGALTAELVGRLGPASVAAVDPSEPFVEACRRRHPGVEVGLGRAEELPYPDGRFDAALAQLVLHFVSDADLAAREMARVVRPGGAVAACVWDFGDGMRMLQAFWEAARALDSAAPAESDTRRFGRPGEIAALFDRAGLADVVEGSLMVEAAYEDFEDFWSPFLSAVGPAGAYASSLGAQRQAELREELRTRIGAPAGAFTLPARAWYASGRV